MYTRVRVACPAASPDPLPGQAGSYVLLFHLPDCLCGLDVGRLGRWDFAAGSWVYCGSAWGPGGLRARIGRHLRRNKRHHWHIDALTGLLAPQALLYVVQDGEARRRLECLWIQRLLALPAGWQAPILGFGSSDCCSGCPAHLLHHPGWIPAGELEKTLWPV